MCPVSIQRHAHPEICILVPTREREEVLSACLDTLVAQDYERLRIIVSDNASTDNTREVVETFQDPRIQYVNTGRRVSMSHNWEFALRQVPEGAWVGYLGDDDGLVFGAIGKVADFLRETGAMAVRARAAFYLWPKVQGNQYGVLSWKERYCLSFRRHRLVGARRQLRRVLCGEISYMDAMSIYVGGVVHVSVLRRAMRNGRFFHSMIPDIYASMAILKSVDEIAYLDEVLAINGSSRHSTGLSAFSRKPGMGTTGNRFFEEENLPFHPQVPLMRDGRHPRSIPALVYESYLQNLFLGEVRARCASPLYQLGLILYGKGLDEEECVEWTERFCKRNGLTNEMVERRLPAVMRRIRLARLRGSVVRMSRAREVHGAPGEPLTTVADAARRLVSL